MSADIFYEDGCSICLTQRAFVYQDNDGIIRCVECRIPVDKTHPEHRGAVIGFMFALGDKMKKDEAFANRSVPTIMRDGAETYEQRNALWGDNYKQAGAVMLALLPGGVELKSIDDWNRFGIFMHVMNKVTRYAQNLNNGGNLDSAHDLMVYAAMLEELTVKQS